MFNIGGTVTIYGKIDVSTLQQAIQDFIICCDAFQIRIKTNEQEPQQYFDNSPIESIPFIDFRMHSAPIEEYKYWIQKKAKELFIIEEQPLYDFAVFCLDDNTYGYLIKLHHLIADGWSIQILTKMIESNYEKSKENLSDAEVFSSYKDYLISENEYFDSKRFQSDKQFWKENLSELPKETKIVTADIVGNRKTYNLEVKRVEMIRTFCDHQGLSLNTFFMAIYILFEYKQNFQENIVIGNPTYGRLGKQKNTFGMFVSSMPFHYKIRSSITLLNMIHEVNGQIREHFRHQRYPYNSIINDLQLGNQPLYTACINYYSTSMQTIFNGYPTDNWEFYNGEQDYDIQLIIREWTDDNGIQIDIDYKTAIFTEKQIDEVIMRLNVLMDTVFTSPEKEISQIDVLSKGEKDNLFVKFNNNYNMPQITNTVIDLIKSQIEKYPARTAVEHNGINLSFRDLDRQTDILAFMLKDSGLHNNEIAAIYMKNSIDVFIGILGIMKAGGAFLPIDMNCPPERIQYMLEDSKSRFLITNLETNDIFFSGTVISINEVINCLIYNNSSITCEIKQDNLAYVLYTSGSTGRPKGVMINHAALFNYIQWACRQYITMEQEVFPLYTSLSFDLTITTLFVPLASGGTVVVYDDKYIDKAIERMLSDDRCTIIKMTPSHLQLICNMDKFSSSVKKLILGGENLSVELARSACATFGEDIIIYNEYGPTEATVGCMIYQYNPRKDCQGSVPIGKPIDRFCIYILDKDRNPVPVGWPGEIYIAGSGVAQGYLNKPELTSQVFIKDKRYRDEPLYRTGDLARFICDDCMEYIGRIDNQKKLNGFRIELGEIEWSLQLYPDILQAAALIKVINNTPVLCAYYTAKVNLVENTIREHLLKRLPAYMIPSLILQVDRFPLTENGKINTDLLPVPEINLIEKSQISENENVVLQVISNLMDMPVVSNTNFYHIGGDSIKAIQLSSRLHAQGFELSAKDILAHPVISEMALCIQKDSESFMEPKMCSGTIEETPMHKWFMRTQMEKPSEYCQSMVIELNDSWAVKSLENILALLIKHHDVLRICMDQSSKKLFYNHELSSKQNIKFTQIEHLEDKDIFLRECKERLIRQIDIFNGPVICSEYISQNNAPDIWLLVIHHFAIDGVSWSILLEDIHYLMDCYKNNRELVLSGKTNSFQAWAAHISSKITYHQKYEGAKDQLVHKPYAAQYPVMCSGILSEDMTSMLKNKAGLSYNMKAEDILIASLILAYKICFNQNNILIEVEGNGRFLNDNKIDVSRTLGWFTCIYPIMFPIDSENMDHHLKITKETLRREISSIPKEYTPEEWDVLDSNAIRFNYLGEVKECYPYFNINAFGFVDDLKQARLTSLFEVICLIHRGCLHYWVFGQKELILENEMQGFSISLSECIEKIISHCINKKEIEFTPSDFEMTDYTQEDLNTIFS